MDLCPARITEPMSNDFHVVRGYMIISGIDMLEATAPGVRVLANMRTYLDKTCGPCMTAFENRLGGWVVVAGYGPWMYLSSTAKREQLLTVADWITRGRCHERRVSLLPSDTAAHQHSIRCFCPSTHPRAPWRHSLSRLGPAGCSGSCPGIISTG